jgi:enoyl-CoA hydratase
MNYENILVETRGSVGIITLNRPKALNALSVALMREMGQALDAFEADDGIGAVVITGSDKAFAAGADIGEMQHREYMDLFMIDFPHAPGDGWRSLKNMRKPVIAAVAGFALGGGCEVAMICDMIIAADNAKFGQPEITLATMPGAGGTQRLVRAIGKAKAMELCLTGRMMDAREAERAGLVSRIVPAAELMDDAVKTAAKIAGMSRPVAQMIKESIVASFSTGLDEGLRLESRLFHSTFATADQKEGMSAFVEKRKPEFKNR